MQDVRVLEDSTREDILREGAIVGKEISQRNRGAQNVVKSSKDREPCKWPPALSVADEVKGCSNRISH